MDWLWKGVAVSVAALLVGGYAIQGIDAVAQVPRLKEQIEETEQAVKENEQADKEREEEAEERLRKLEDITLQGAIQQKHLTESVDKLVEKLSE